MVDLLGRAGLISEAQEFIKNMPIAPDAFVWGALLGACKMYVKVELGESNGKTPRGGAPERWCIYTHVKHVFLCK